MSAFPDIIGSGYTRNSVVRGAVADLGSLHHTRYRKWLNPRNTINLSWDVLDQADKDTIEAFIVSVGVNHDFVWFDWRALEWKGVLVALGDSTTTLFTLPAVETSDLSYTVAGADTAGTLSIGTGANGEDQVTFADPPENNAQIRASFTGRRRYPVFLSGNNFTFQMIPGSIITYTATLVFLEKK
jgi:hypothetical protein